MRRRKMLQHGGLVLSSVALSGCSELSSSDESSNPPDTEQEGENNVQQPALQEASDVEFSEELVSADIEYAVTATVTMNDADEVEFTTSDSTLGTATSDGQITLGSEESGLLGLHTQITATAKASGESVPAGIYTVGSQAPPPHPTQVIGLSASSGPDTSIEGQNNRDFQFDWNGETLNASMSIPNAIYDFYQNRIHNREYGAYVTNSYGDIFIEPIAGTIRDFAERRNLSRAEIVSTGLSFVQSLEYVQDEVGTGYNEYPKFPAETIVDRGGDCEDSAILLAALLMHLDYDVVLLELPDANHMALGVALDDFQGSHYTEGGTNYYYAETTATGWNLGEVPPDAQVSAILTPVGEYPLLVHQWVTGPVPRGGAEISGIVRNIGDSTANDVRVEVLFENRSNEIVANNSTTVSGIDSETQSEWSVPVLVPEDTTVRGRVRIHLNGTLHDETVSEWREPQS